MGDSLTDVDLGAGRTAVSVAANGGHTCAILDNASVECWGLNTWGQMGRLPATALRPIRWYVRRASASTTASVTPRTRSATLTAAIAGQRCSITRRLPPQLRAADQRSGEMLGLERAGQLGIEDITGDKSIIGDTPDEIAALAITALKPAPPWKS